jgi:hypothetical protein
MAAKVKGVFVTPQRTAGQSWLSFPRNVTEYGGPTGPLCPQPPPPSCRRRRYRHAAADSVAMLPSPPSCRRRNRRRAFASAAAALSPPPPPRFRLRRRRAATKLPTLPPSPSFLSLLIPLSLSPFPTPLPPTLLVDC